MERRCKMERKQKEILEYQNVGLQRGGKILLDNITWKIQEGENWVLLGLNGSGKTSLLSMIPAYIFPSQGELKVFGKKFGDCVWEEVKKKIGFVSSSLQQFVNSLNKQSVEELVLSGKFHSIGIYQDLSPQDMEKAKEILQKFQIGHLKDQKYRTLSQGEQRKVFLARSFMNEPEFLILDEACSGLDMKARENLLYLLENYVKEKKIPYLYVTHRLEEILPSVTHVAILHEGSLLAQGRKEDIIQEDFLSKLYGVRLRIEWEKGRPWLIVKGLL